MSNLIEDWLGSSKPKLTELGFIVNMNESTGSVKSIDIDNNEFVGTICFWEPSTVEIQFNSCLTGNMVYLETAEVIDSNDLDEIVQRAFDKLAIC